MSNKINPNQAAALLQPDRNLKDASIYQNYANPDALVSEIIIPLDEARTEANPHKISLPFLSCYIAEASDNSANIQLKMNTRNANHGKLTLINKDAFEFDLPVSGAYIINTAQPGKWVRLFFFLNSRFRSGTIRSLNAGGVTISAGALNTAPVSTTLVALTANGVAVPANSNRNTAIIYNNTGADIFMGADNTVTDSNGIPIKNQERYLYNSQAGIWLYSVAGGQVRVMEWTN